MNFVLRRAFMGNEVNHSCEPNVVFDLSSKDASKWHIRALQDVGVGTARKGLFCGSHSYLCVQAVTFFYPSTEWDMDQPFRCICGRPVGFKLIVRRPGIFLTLFPNNRLALNRYKERNISPRKISLPVNGSALGY